MRHRPERLDQIIGHKSIVRSLEKIIEEKACHAFLFGGPSGIGKTTLARIVARTISGTLHPYLVEIDAASNSGAEDARRLLEDLSFRPFGGGANVVIIDEAQALSKQAWQVLLKSLEEVPAWLYWFLCTSEMSKVPVAIRRRCATYELRALPYETISDLIEKIADEEKLFQGRDGEAILKLCAKEAAGSPGRALMNMTICFGAKDSDDAAALLQSAVELPAAIDLARALFRNAPWREIGKILNALKDENPESVRHLVRSYMTSVLLNRPGIDDRAHRTLKAFSQPFSSSDGISPLVLAAATVCSSR